MTAILLSIHTQEPEQYCSAGTAAEMAKAAYQRAANLCGFGSHIVGLGATCALATVSAAVVGECYVALSLKGLSDTSAIDDEPKLV